MKKYLLALGLIVVFVFYIIFSNRQSSTATPNTPVTTNTTGTDNSSPSAQTNTPPARRDDDDDDYSVPNIPVTAVVPSSSTWKDGTYTSPSVDAYFGQIQLSATVKGGKLTDITMLKFPNDRGTSEQLSNTSLPKLKTEAIAAQSNKVNIVSGATQTSQGFMQALGLALAQAAK